jgi:hypothetical protein
VILNQRLQPGILGRLCIRLGHCQPQRDHLAQHCVLGLPGTTGLLL